jgi:hypothetical protein
VRLVGQDCSAGVLFHPLQEVPDLEIRVVVVCVFHFRALDKQRVCLSSTWVGGHVQRRDRLRGLIHEYGPAA